MGTGSSQSSANGTVPRPSWGWGTKGISLTWETGSVQERKLSEQPGEVPQSPADLFTFLRAERQGEALKGSLAAKGGGNITGR